MNAEKEYQEKTSTLNVNIANINTANKNGLMFIPNVRDSKS